MHCPGHQAHAAHELPPWGAWALEIGLSLLILGYVFRSVLAFAAWTLEFLWR